MPSIEKLRANSSATKTTSNSKIPTIARFSPPPPPPPSNNDVAIINSNGNHKLNGSLGSSAAVASAIKRVNATDNNLSDHDNKTKDEWWDRVNRVAEGREQAAPADLRLMLKSGGESAEERLSKKGTFDHLENNVNVTTNKRHSTSGYGFPRQALPSSSIAATTNSQNTAVNATMSSNLYKDSMQRRHSDHGNGQSTNSNTSTAAVFEKEAQALQEELEQMQKTLQDRMKRYQALSSSAPDK